MEKKNGKNINCNKIFYILFNIIIIYKNNYGKIWTVDWNQLSKYPR